MRDGQGTAPMVSVVMPSFNQARFIDASIESVLGQSHQRLELIVADGGSTDGTVEQLAAWQQRDARLRYFSERDNGPADAVNKALARVRGTVVGWLNSDDLYTRGAIERAVQALAANTDWVCVYGRGEHIDEHGSHMEEYPTLAPPAEATRLQDGCFICQPTMFFRRTMYVLLGPLDTTLKTVFDFEYWLRLFTRMPGRIGFVDAVQAQSRLHRDCITRRMQRTVALEAVQVLRRHLGRAPVHWLQTYAKEAAAGGEDAASLGALLDEAKSSLTEAQCEELRAEWQLASSPGSEQ